MLAPGMVNALPTITASALRILDTKKPTQVLIAHCARAQRTSHGLVRWLWPMVSQLFICQLLLSPLTPASAASQIYTRAWNARTKASAIA